MKQPIKHTVTTIQAMKTAGTPITMLTAYDATQAMLAQEAEIDIILVGDSVGMVVLGHESTIFVTIEDMIHHAKAVRKGAPRTMMIVDMPFLTYHQTTADTVRLAGRLMQEAMADAVKLEGGTRIVPHVEALVQAGIPVCGHLGLTPQSVLQMGGYKVQAKDPESAQRLVHDAAAIQESGAFLLVLEGVPTSVGRFVTQSVSIPTIGIGAGDRCDGQVLVFHDLLGLSYASKPKFVKQYASLRNVVVDAIQSYRDDVRTRRFPDGAHRYDIGVSGFLDEVIPGESGREN